MDNQQTGIEGAIIGDHARIEINQHINSPRQSRSKNFDIPNNLGSRGLEFDKFLGREQDLESLHAKLAAQDPQKLQMVLVTGMPGVGKSELMVQYGQRHLAEFTGGVGWFAAANFGEGVRDFVQEHFVEEDSRDLRYGNDAAFQVQSSWKEWQNFCGENGSALILIDDVQNYQEQVQPYLDGLPRGRCPFQIVMTSRIQLQSSDNFKSLEIGELRLEDGVRLFLDWAAGNPSVVNNQQNVEELCGRLGCLPLALILTGSWLAEQERTLEGLILALEKEGISTKALEPNLLDPRLKIKQGLDAAIAVSWRGISTDAQQLGRVLSLFAAADLPWKLVAGTIAVYGDRPTQEPARLIWWQRVWRWLCGCVGIKLPRLMVNLAFFPIANPQEAKITLRRSSLLQSPQEKVYRLHPLIHEFMSQQWAKTDREGWRESLLKSLSDRAGKIPQEPTWEDAQNYQIFVPHFQHGKQEADFLYQQAITPDQKKIYRSQKNNLDGGVYRLNIALIVETTYQNANRFFDRAKAASALGDQQAAANFFAQAIEGYERAIDQAKQALPNGMLLAGYLLKIAGAFQSLGKYKKGIALAEEAVRIAEAKAKPVQLAKYLNLLAMLHYYQGNYSEAEPLYGRSLQIRETQLGADHPDTANSLNNLAVLYQSMGRYSEAEPLFGRSLHIKETQLGADHPDTANSLNSLAALYRVMGRYSEAEPLFGRSLHIKETQLGADHPDTANSLNSLAVLYYTMGRYSDAEPLYGRSLHIRETQLGADHPDTANSLNSLAVLYYTMGRYSEAEPLFGRSLHIKETQLGADHPDTANSLNSLAALYQSMGRYSDAEPLYERSLHIYKTQLGADHPDTANSLNNLANFYSTMGRYSEAEPLYLRTLEIRTKSLGENHPNTQKAWGNFRYLLQQALAHGSADSLSPHPLTQQLLQEMRE